MKKITLLFISIALYFNAFATVDTLNVNITSDTTLSADTIFVGQQIVVETGNTLTIDPGVVMIFKSDTTYNNMQNTTAGFLYVKGKLNAVGEFDNRIKFTKADTLNWGGILFHSTADTSILKYCNISFSNGIDSLENIDYKGAVSVSNSKVKIYSCNFSDNQTALSLNGANIKLYNNIFTNNNAAILALASDFFMGSNTITNNVSSVVCATSSNPTIVNSIVFGNTNAPTWVNATITYSNVEDGFAGTGNLNIDPEFDTMYKLLPCSGVINLGSTDAANLLEDKDYFGNNRVFSTVVDMGAYEHQFAHDYYSVGDTSVYSICSDSIEINGKYYSTDTAFVTIYTPATNYCDSTVNIRVELFSMSALTFSPVDTMVCLGKKAWISPILTPSNPDAIYTWTSNDTLETIITNDSSVFAEMDVRTKEYYINVNINGCEIIDTAKISVHDEYIINLGPDSTDVCRGHIIDAGEGQNAYEWSTGETTNDIIILTTDIYSVTVTDTNNCRYNNQVYVPILPSAVVDFSADTITIFSDGSTIIGGASLGYSSYLWNTGETTPFITVEGKDLAPGNHEYWLYCAFTNGCDDSDTVIVKVLDEVNVDELSTVNGINIYPNPSNGIININGEFKNNGNVSLTITDLTGKIVSLKEFDNISVLNYSVDLSNNTKGIYFVKINHNNKVSTYKISIQ